MKPPRREAEAGRVGMRLALLVVAVVVTACGPTGPVKPERSLDLKSLKPERSLEQKSPKVLPSAAPSAGTLTFTGSGVNTTEVFELPGGDYLIAWDISGEDCGLYTVELNPIGHDEVIAFGVAGLQAESGSDTVRLDGGRYAFDVNGCTSWEVSIAPR